MLEVGVVPLDGQVDHGVKQGVTWGDKVRWRHTGHLDLLALESDSLVGDEHGSRDPDDAVTVADRTGDMGHLVSACLTAAEAAAEAGEGIQEERLDEVRLQTPGLSFLEAPPHLLDVAAGDDLPVEGTLGKELVEALADGRVNDGV